MVSYLHVKTFGCFFESFKFDQSGFDTICHDSIHREVLVEKSFVWVTIRFKKEEIAVGRNFAADGTDGLHVKEFQRWPNLALLLRLQVRLWCPKSTSWSRIVCAWYQLQMNLFTVRSNFYSQWMIIIRLWQNFKDENKSLKRCWTWFWATSTKSTWAMSSL